MKEQLEVVDVGVYATVNTLSEQQTRKIEVMVRHPWCESEDVYGIVLTVDEVRALRKLLKRAIKEVS
jgi:hypothetical protein